MGDIEEKRLQKKLEKARETNKYQDIGRLCRRLAVHYSEHGQYDKALDMYKEELNVCEIVKDAEGISTANRMIGEMYCSLGQYEESLRYTELYLEYSIVSNDKVEEQRAYATIGRVYLCWATQISKSGDKKELEELLKKCTEAFKKSLNICEKELRNISEKERLEMKARLLYNLGLASEIQGQTKTAQTYISKAIFICKNEFLSEDLVRCYIAQGEIFLKTNDLPEAQQSFSAAETSSSSAEQTVVVLLYQAKVHFLMCNYSRAKHVLKKAYKLKSPNENDNKIVIKRLYQAIKLCNLEKKLLETDENDFEAREKLFEEFGDTCCAVKNYKHAIQLYQNMLDYAQKNGKSGKELLPCYTSLSQTYKDDKQFDLALEYCEKELKLTEGDPEEYCKTYISIGEILKLKGSSYEEVSDTFHKAKEIAEDNNDHSQKILALKRLYSLQLKFKKLELAEETKKEIELLRSSLDFSSDDDCDYDSDSESESEVEIQEISSDSDNNEEFDRPRIRQRRCAFKFKRNEKGETPLHTAAIKGDYNRAKKLIEQGHPVKEQDSAGWTPLHEACNWGRVDIVNLLLDNGADINDPGGIGCEGVTPLHDAASNAHFEIIDLLLKRGASTAVMTNKGETPQDFLKEWRNRSDLSDDEEIIYEKYFELLKSPVENIVAKNKFKKHSSSDAALVTVDDVLVGVSKKLKQSLSKIKITESSESLRRRADDFDEEESKEKWYSASPDKEENFSDLGMPNWVSDDDTAGTSATKEYQAAIDVFRKRQVDKPSANKLEKITSVLLNEDDVVDDWLEDDLQFNAQPQKKRRTNNSLLNHDSVKNSLPRPSTSKTSILEPPQMSDITENLDEDLVEIQNERNLSNPRMTPPPTLPTVRQNSPYVEADVNEIAEPTQQAEIPTNSTQSSANQPLSSDVYKVRVDVLDQKILIPIERNKMKDLKISWLTEEVSTRYSQLVGGTVPIIKLKTKDGAVLTENDSLSLIYNEDIECEITGWKSISLGERYKQAFLTSPKSDTNSNFCRYKFNQPDISLIKALDACESTYSLNLSNLALTCDDIAPVLKVLKHQKNLKNLNLSGNMLEDEGLSYLVECLETLTVEEINVSCNNITSEGINYFNESLSKIESLLNQISVLDFSFNPIGSESADSLKHVFGGKVKTDFCDEFKVEID